MKELKEKEKRNRTPVDRPGAPTPIAGAGPAEVSRSSEPAAVPNDLTPLGERSLPCDAAQLDPAEKVSPAVGSFLDMAWRNQKGCVNKIVKMSPERTQALIESVVTHVTSQLLEEVFVPEGEEPPARENFTHWWTVAHWLAKFNKVEIFKALIKRGCSFDHLIDGISSTIIHYATRYNHYDLLTLVLSHSNKSINALDAYDKSALMWSCEDEKRLKFVTLLLESKASVHIRQSSGGTALFCAARGGSALSVDAILAEQANPNSEDDTGWTPLMLAAHCGQSKVCERLLRAKADPEKRTRQGATALLVASQQGHTEVINLLLKRGVKMDIPDLTGATPLICAATNGHITACQTLLTAGASINRVTEEGYTALMAAVCSGHSGVAQVLLAKDALVTQHDNAVGGNLLMLACASRDVEMTRLLMDRNVPINEQQMEGWSALGYAIAEGDVECVNSLLASGADAYRHPGDWNTLLLAVQFGDFKSIRAMLQHHDANESGSGVYPLHVAAAYGMASVARLLLGSGARVHVTDKSGLTPLHLACKYHHEETASILLEGGADINATCHASTTPLMLAVPDDDLVDGLLQCGPNIDAQDRNGETALFKAVVGDHAFAVKELLRSGAESQLQAKGGFTALMMAASGGNTKFLGGLLANKADPNIEDDYGNTAIFFAVNADEVEAAHLLLQYGADPDHVNRDDETALYVAIQRECYPLIETLLVYKASPLISTRKLPLRVIVETEDTAALTLVLENCPVVFHHLENNGSPLLMNLVAQQRLVIAERIIRNPAVCPNLIGKDDTTLLMVAVRTRQLFLVQTLLDRAADLTKRDKNGETALIIAARVGSSDIVRALVDAGADVAQTDNRGYAPVHHIFEGGVDDKLRAMMRDIGEHLSVNNHTMYDFINAVDSQGNTALHQLVLRGDEAAINILLSYGASRKLKNASGHIPVKCVYTVKGLCEDLAPLIENDWKALGLELYKKDVDPTEKVTLIAKQYRNSARAAAQQLLSEWSKFRREKFKLDELTQALTQVGLLTMCQPVLDQVMNRKPVWSSRVISMLEENDAPTNQPWSELKRLVRAGAVYSGGS